MSTLLSQPSDSPGANTRRRSGEAGKTRGTVQPCGSEVTAGGVLPPLIPRSGCAGLEELLHLTPPSSLLPSARAAQTGTTPTLMTANYSDWTDPAPVTQPSAPPPPPPRPSIPTSSLPPANGRARRMQTVMSQVLRVLFHPRVLCHPRVLF